MEMKRALVGVMCASAFFTSTAFSQNRDVSARDCVQVRYITGVWMNPQGTRVAYVVKSPNLNRNRNDYQLYVRSLKDESPGLGKLLITSTEITDVRWLYDGNHLTILTTQNGVKSLIAVSSDDGSRQTLLRPSGNMEAYSIDAAGNTIAYSIADREAGKHALGTQSDDEIADGYRIAFGESKSSGYLTSTLNIVHRQPNGTWSSPERVTIEDPFTHERFEHIRGLSELSLSPDAKHLALNYWTDSPLTEWSSSPYVKENLQLGPMQRVLILQDLKKHTSSLGFKTVFPDSVPLWSADSKSFLMNAHSPAGSTWEQDDIRDHRVSALDANLFWIDVESGQVEEILRHVPSHHEGPMLWRRDGDIVVHMLNDTVSRFHRGEDGWRDVEQVKIPKKEGEQFYWLASNGDTIVGVHQTLTAPHNLFSYSASEKSIHILTNLNSQLKQLRFADVRDVSWTTAEGLTIDGLLFVPSDYIPGKRYPLVIQTKGDQGQFTCDSGVNHDPSFAPQPIASAGMMYLARTTKPGFNFQDELAKEPKGYPGQLGFAAKEMHIWESAVDYLNSAGLIDPSKVGIVGFSATGFYVEFSLIHSRIHYAAATATDNEQGSISEYWLTPASSDAEESLYGGPPYGKTLDNWQKYSISFNMEKVHTPLLMEEMGYGVHDDIVGQIPRNLAVRYELYKGLTRLGKPVEMYYYPNEGHAPDDPRARLASLQRNVDWYRFWLQGLEDPDPKKKEQYLRWRTLRTLSIKDTQTDLVRSGSLSGSAH